MDARPNAFELSSRKPSRQGRNQRFKVAGAIVVLLVLLMLATYSPQMDSKATPVATPQNDGGTATTYLTDYFPAQFPSPRTTAILEEHTQAF